MKTIPLAGGFEAKVDDGDFAYLSQFHWCVSRQKHAQYAVSCDYSAGRRKRLMMHRLILGARPGVKVDHRDGDGLNNTKSNLRLATNSQNAWNAKKPTTGLTSKYKGVSRSRGGFQVAIKFNRKKIFLGRFRDEAEAAKAYNIKALELFGAFAKLNQIGGS